MPSKTVLASALLALFAASSSLAAPTGSKLGPLPILGRRGNIVVADPSSGAELGCLMSNGAWAATTEDGRASCSVFTAYYSGNNPGEETTAIPTGPSTIVSQDGVCSIATDAGYLFSCSDAAGPSPSKFRATDDQGTIAVVVSDEDQENLFSANSVPHGDELATVSLATHSFVVRPNQGPKIHLLWKYASA